MMEPVAGRGDPVRRLRGGACPLRRGPSRAGHRARREPSWRRRRRRSSPSAEVIAARCRQPGRARVEVRETGQLDPADLVELAADGGAVVVDAVVGVPVGEVVVLPLEVVAAGTRGTSAPVPRSAARATGGPARGARGGAARDHRRAACWSAWGAAARARGADAPAVAVAIPALTAAIRAEIERLVAAAS